MSIQVWAFAFALAGSLPLFLWSLSGADPRAEAIRANLGEGPSSSADVRELQLTRSARQRLVAPMLGRAGRVVRRLTPTGMVSSLERRIAQAGLTARWPVERLLAVKGLLIGGGLLLGLVGLVGNPTSRGLLAGLALPIGAYLAPDLVLSQRATKRQDLILRQLPDVLDEITISVEAGLGFEAAMAQAGRTSTGPLADEFMRTIQDIRVGVSRAEALNKLVQRTEVADLRHFVVAVRQAEQYGVPIARVLRVQSKEMRERRRQRAEERAMKMPVKILIPTVFFILPSLFIVILGPAVLRLADSLSR